MNEIVKVEVVNFHGDKLETFLWDNKEYVAMKPIVCGMGLNWSRQQRKLKRDAEVTGYVLKPIPSKGGEQLTGVIPLENLSLWLASVSVSRIKKPEVKKKVISYQKDCAIALYDFWTKGIAVRTTHNPLASEEFLEQYYKERRAREILEHDHNLVSPDVSYGTLSQVNGLPRTEIVRSYPRSQRKDKRPSEPKLYLDGCRQRMLFYE